MARRFRVRRDLIFSNGILPKGEVVTEASLADTGREYAEFKRILFGRKRAADPTRLGGARILFWWNGKHRTAVFGRDLEAERSGGGWTCNQ